jgi:NAD(P)-dependent dehydrogenase (short-subunit alcohol dehydrogenase family)
MENSQTEASSRSMVGKTAVITGGSTGIGLATAQILAKWGARVVLFARSESDLSEAKQSLPRGSVVTVAGDVRKESDLARLFEVAGPTDALFVNAGVAEFCSLEEADVDHFDRMVDTNLRGAFLTMKHGASHLRAGCSVLFSTSVAGNIGAPLCSVYGATKGAVAAFARNLGAELLPRQIRVNSISPGPTMTPIQVKSALNEAQMATLAPFVMGRMRMGRLGDAAEVAQAAAFLLSPASSFITGQELAVDGGMTGI